MNYFITYNGNELSFKNEKELFKAEVNNTKITGWIPINGLRNIDEVKIHIKE